MHTSNSKVSKESNKSHKKTNEIRAQIKEEFEEESEESSDSFDLENYDEYLLTKDMDAIFDDMAITDEFGNVK